MSYYRRGYNWEEVEYLPAPVGGWNPDAIPWELPSNQAAALDNFLLRPGKIVARGAFTQLVDTSASAPAPVALVPAGAFCITNMATVGCMPWDAPALGSAANKLAQASTTLTWTDSVGDKTTITAASRHLVPGPRWINFDGELYGLGFDSEVSPLQDAAASYFMPATQLLTQGFTVFMSSGSIVDQMAASGSGTSWTISSSGGHVQEASQASLANGATTTPVTLTNYGLSVPSGATITSTSFFKLGTDGSFSENAHPCTVTAQLVNGGSLIGSPVTQTVAFGGSVEIEYQILLSAFSASLTPAIVNSSTFGVQMTVTNNSGASAFVGLNGRFTIYYGSSTSQVPAAMTVAPQGAIDVAGHLGALWLLGGSDTPGTKTTLSGTLSTGGAITALPVAALTKAYPNGAQVVVWSSATQSQTWTLTAGAAVGATSLAVSSQTPNFAYPSGTTVVCASAATHSATSIFYSNSPLAAGGGAAVSDWQDPSSGLTNIIRLDQDSSDPGMGLAATRNGLLIFRRNSVWLIKGSSPANFAAVQLTNETGCLDPRSIIETDSGVYFVGQKGLMLTDGTRVTNVSGSCTYTLQQAVNAQQWNVVTGYGGYITSALTTQGQIIVSIGARNSSGGLVPIWCAMYDPTAVKGGAWVRITSTLFQNDGTQTAGNYYPGLVVSDTLSALRSVHALGSKFFTMLEDQALAYSFLNQSSLYDGALAGVTYAIPLRWRTRFVPIIGTTTLKRKFAQVKRYFLDHTLSVSGGTVVPGTSPGWVVNAVDASDTQFTSDPGLTSKIISSTSTSSVSAGYGLAPNIAIQRENADFAGEVDDLGFEIIYQDAATNSSASGVVAAIYGVGAEYQTTRDKR